MFWADEFVDEIEKQYAEQIKAGITLRIRDEKTLSGRVHVGSLRGVVLHGIISEILTERGIKHEYLFELNDIDPMDGLPGYLDEATFRPHMGKPLYAVPSPDGKAKNFPEYYGKEFVEVIESIGFHPTYYRARETYETGGYNEAIRLALRSTDDIRNLYREVSGSEKGAEWMPLQVICEQCGKVGTTKVVEFDGNKVRYTCEPALVTWAVGCGHEGWTEPWDGKAKLPWKVEWAAKFAFLPRPINTTRDERRAVPYGVDIEGAGKDHATKGGSRDIADHICTQIFKHPAPFDIPYNFFVVGGKKMGSSTAMGSSAKDVADLLPPELSRLLMIRKQPKHEIDFVPSGNTIPLLFDEYDRVADAYFDEAHDRMDDPVRFYHFAQLPERRATSDVRANYFRPRFSLVAFMVQMPHLDPLKEIETLKGSPLTKKEKEVAQERITYARQWLEKCSPEEYKFELQQQLPPLELTPVQRTVIERLHAYLSENPKAKGEEIHQFIHTLKEELKVTPKEVFEPLYKMFLNRSSGPQAGWFLGALDRSFVLNRLKEAIR